MRIAILAPTAAAAFRRARGHLAGGAETQLILLGEALSLRGHRVDVIVAGDDENPEESAGGCHIWPRYPLSGIPLVKTAHPKFSALFRTLRMLGSELLLQRGAADLTGIARAASGALGIPFVFAVASESDLVAGLEILPHTQDRIFFRLGAAGADLVVTQTRVQERAAWRQFGGEVCRIPSFYARLGEATVRGSGAGPGKILWCGNLRSVKRPELLVTLADQMPEHRFVVVGGAALGHEAYAARMGEILNSRENIDYRGPVSRDILDALFRECRVLLNTSSSEGFPNTFLEAWRYGLTVVASVDPDGLLKQRGLGVFGKSPARLKQALREVLDESADLRQARNLRATRYLESEHSPGKILEQWESSFQALL